MPNEKAEIKRIGATPVPNSGRGLAKGDCILGDFLIDIKEYKKTFGLSEDMWSKISTDSIKNGRRQPALRVVLGEEGTTRTRLWVFGDAVGQEFIEWWNEKYGDK